MPVNANATVRRTGAPKVKISAKVTREIMNDYMKLCVQNAKNRADNFGFDAFPSVNLARFLSNDPKKFLYRCMISYMQHSNETIAGQVVENAFVRYLENYGTSTILDYTFSNVDLVVEMNNTIHLIQVKSAPRWGNAPSRKRLQEDMDRAVASLKKSFPSKKIVCFEALLNCPANPRGSKHSANPVIKISVDDLLTKFCGHRVRMKEMVCNAMKDKNDQLETCEKKAINERVRGLLPDFDSLFCTNGKVDVKKLTN